jgi:hypothetical protein
MTMLTLHGSHRRLCDGLTRRDLLHLGGLSLLGLTLADTLAADQARASRAPPNGGKARACILLFPYGSPPQHETFDPKPDAPAEVRGELGSIATSLPGLRICERLPRIARVMDRVTVVRSVTHRYPVHGVAYALTGIPTYSPALETRPRDPRHWPFIGSVVDYLEEQRARKCGLSEPRNVALPWMLNSKTDLLVNAGPFAAFLGQAYDPVWTDFTGRGTRLAPEYTRKQAKRFLDPFAATTPAGRFSFSAGGASADVPVERLALRRSLLNQFEAARRGVDRALERGAVDRQRALAFNLLTSSGMRQALDIGKEPMALRERYGMTLFGQSCLAARRLVEAGCKFVTVFWDGYGQFANCAWDTHQNHFPRLKEYLLPGFDLAYSALIEDLQTRGLLGETLVLWLSEHGRTPRIDSRWKGGGRDHWSRTYSVALAGGGVARGRVVGASDRLGGEVKSTPVSPKDLLATAFHLLGYDPATTVRDRQGRPMPIAGDGRVRRDVLGG